MSVLGFLAFSNSTKYPIRNVVNIHSQTISISSKRNYEINDLYNKGCGGFKSPFTQEVGNSLMIHLECEWYGCNGCGSIN
ncbi:MAG TPA: hypothetical protein VK503_06805, partial [Candidatus Bathyarchaeia archaeon]|nr:hypothetical protein [Candidatus Bathyarchaeia archaeon]